MKYLSLLLVTILSYSCEQNIVAVAQNIEENSLDYFLEFDITSINYLGDKEQDQTAVFSNQDLEAELVFYELNTLDRYFYFAYDLNSTEDAVALLGQLRFTLDESTPFEQEVFHLEFVLAESRSNLTEQPDGTFRYTDLSILANHLEDQDWGSNSFFGGGRINQFLLTFPDTSLEEYGPGSYTITSNGFYFEHEHLDFTAVEYQQATNEIILSGTFGVEMKELSCGFYSFFSVTNANFRALIQ
ncbi:MAG: hypothetical protein AAFO03_02965 [Bacteroidota bacterium]